MTTDIQQRDTTHTFTHSLLSVLLKSLKLPGWFSGKLWWIFLLSIGRIIFIIEGKIPFPVHSYKHALLTYTGYYRGAVIFTILKHFGSEKMADFQHRVSQHFLSRAWTFSQRPSSLNLKPELWVRVQLSGDGDGHTLKCVLRFVHWLR